MPKRWPVRPDLIPGECLSSWLRRIGCSYGCSVDDLLKYDLDFAEVKARGLDMAAPRELLRLIAARTGLPVETICNATYPGTVPFLLQHPYFTQANSDFEFYRVPFKRLNPAPKSLEKITRWFRKEVISKIHGCRQCLDDYPDAPVLLAWGLDVVLSCPTHGLMLEPAHKDPRRLKWINEKAEAAPDLVCRLDSRTMAAVAQGSVKLPSGLVSALQWFSLMHTIFQELNAPVYSIHRARLRWQLKLWNSSGYYPTGTFETFKFDKSAALLISTAMDLMEKREEIRRAKKDTRVS